MQKYDLCIIGGGPAGYAAAMRAIDFGKKVLLIEKDKVGGAGIFNGALSSKSMWEYSQKYASIQDEIQAVTSLSPEKTWQHMMKNVDEAVFERKFQLSIHLKLLQSEISKKIFFYERGHARLLNANEVHITKDSGEVKTIYADYILLATGSRPRKLPTINIDERTIVTSDGVGSFNAVPKSLVILGAGIIGCEFATIFSNLGKTKVYIIDKAERILPFEDYDIAGFVANNLEKNGVTIHKNASLVRMEIKNGKVEYELKFKDGSTEVLQVEKALVSIGRVPNTDDLGLQHVGVQLDERDYVITSNGTQTNIPNIHAAGDLTGGIALLNVGELAGRHAVECMFGKPDHPFNTSNISTIMFLNPEVAAVGMNEQQAHEKRHHFRVAKVDYSCISRAIAMRKTSGFFKIIVTDDDEMKILGMRAVGEHASSAIQAVALLISMNKGIRELAEMIYPHPSIIEGIQECARMLLGKPIFKSSVFKDKLKCYRCLDGYCIPMEKL